MLGVSMVLVLSSWLWAMIALRSVKPTIVFHWVTDGGTSRITQIVLTKDIPEYLGLVGGSAFLLVLINGWIALLFEERHWFWGKFLAGATIVIAALIFIGFIAIIRIN